MTTEKDPKTGKCLIQYRYKDWTGKNRKSTKRGFKTKKLLQQICLNNIEKVCNIDNPLPIHIKKY